MPIILNDIEKSTIPVTTYTPKFFSDKLTGRGGATMGLLSMKNNPAAINPDKVTRPHDNDAVRKTLRVDGNTTHCLPMNPITANGWDCMTEIERPDLGDMPLIGTRQNEELYMNMEIHTIIIETMTISDSFGGPSKTNTRLTTNYQIMFFRVCDKKRPIHTLANASQKSPNTYWIEYTSNPLHEIQTDMIPDLMDSGWNIDRQAIKNYLLKYDLYNAVVRRSELWQTRIDKVINAFLNNVKNNGLSKSNQKRVIEEMKYIMSYNIPLELYKNIYAFIKQNFDRKMVNIICKQNLNLLLSDTMDHLAANKALIPALTPPVPNMALPASINALSKEQITAVTSTEPLILVQAGAGTGKSTLILSRIDYLVNCGVQPQDITVLSFTNAAADHIMEKNPNVHAMTIARMIHTIYSENFKNHELSSLDTVINSLEIYYPPQPGVSRVVDEFSKKLSAMLKNDTNNVTEMNNFIETHYDEVIDILDTIQQTTLELEIIICYQKIDTLIEPAAVTSKYLIIDEVQDNSIFEFIYVLKYIDKHKESLFIVGDSSQTLYEFRASNPRALNILEGSKTFATYQLTVNYRSNQEILDFANIALQNIEANQYAKIQLQANSLRSVTEQSFLDHVKFNYKRLDKIGDFPTKLPKILTKDVSHYINTCVNANEQVAILAYTRREVALIQRILNDNFPTLTTVSLVPQKMYNITVISTFVKKYWNELKFVPYQNIMIIIYHEIMNKLSFLVYDAQRNEPKIQKIMTDWLTEETSHVDAWIQQVSKGQMNEQEMLEKVKDNLIRFEIRKNAAKQALLSAQNQMQKENDATKTANIVLSTIHSAKGLEFDNVIVIYRNENALAEDKKRMYYVALTRAMKSEYILAYDTVSKPQIQADYITVLKHLHDIAPAANSPIDTLLAGKQTTKVRKSSINA